MFATLTLAAFTLASPVPRDAKAAGPAPRLVEFIPDTDGKVRVLALRTEKQKVKQVVPVQKQVVAKVLVNGQEKEQPLVVTENVTREQEVSVQSMARVELSELKNLTIYTADGKEADKALALKKLVDGGTVVVSADGQKVDPKYLKLFRDDTLVLVSPELAAGQTGVGAVGVVAPLPPVGPPPAVGGAPLIKPLPLPVPPADAPAPLPPADGGVVPQPLPPAPVAGGNG
jgi:hypothetical protein